ncbi:uncharacterized protein Z518_01991 [Rhinocladiella mackenziei CBS 650.93]|uniref:Uncharacterized protein n=1 Tax=Rhinocladiella mackenziei CBS 650.93 TaxID=1442369 RepID=A0A0D2HA30_9EURO|nr:uncharacterized protein Z518_01991 [Rhinocladiella mackenziei CBS 650.93]KIX07338.1 hypothetical protein Z518_01991 [Rhinocladiella mackenziei CBS 650.93]
MPERHRTGLVNTKSLAVYDQKLEEPDFETGSIEDGGSRNSSWSILDRAGVFFVKRVVQRRMATGQVNPQDLDILGLDRLLAYI